MSELAPLRWSNLKHMARSAAHYKYYLDNPIKETDAMRVGTRVHELVLMSGVHRFATWEGGVRRGKEWESFQGANADAVILTLDQELRAQDIASAVRHNDLAVAALFGCEVEKTRRWTVADRECMGTPDAVSERRIIDLKVTNDASPNRFPWHARNMGWLAQLAWYDFGVYGGQADRLTLIAAEDKPPFLVTVYDLSPDACETGHRTWRSHFERLRVCEQADVWPGYSEAIVSLEVDREFALHIGGEDVEVE